MLRRDKLARLANNLLLISPTRANEQAEGTMTDDGGTDHSENVAWLGSTKIIFVSKYQDFAPGVIYQWSLLVKDLPFPISLVLCCIV
jgi:hypothetical protein